MPDEVRKVQVRMDYRSLNRGLALNHVVSCAGRSLYSQTRIPRESADVESPLLCNVCGGSTGRSTNSSRILIGDTLASECLCSQPECWGVRRLGLEH